MLYYSEVRNVGKSIVDKSEVVVLSLEILFYFELLYRYMTMEWYGQVDVSM